jgi:hypothetical protein
VVRAEDSRTHNQEDVGSNPDTVYWMDVSVASYYIERKIIKEAKWGTPKKNILKKEHKRREENDHIDSNKIYSISLIHISLDDLEL